MAVVGAFTFSAMVTLLNTWLTYTNVAETPKREITEESLTSTDIASYADRMREFINFRPIYKGEDVHNIVLFHYGFSNTGTEPILPEDFYKPLRISFNDNWRILNIENRWSDRAGYPAPVWSEVGTNTYEAEPFLFNQNDQVQLTIYADTESDDYADLIGKFYVDPSLFVTVSGRILGMERIIRKPEKDRKQKRESDTFFKTGLFDEWPPVSVHIWGRGLVSFFAFATIFFVVYLKLIRSSRVVFFRNESKFNIYLIISFWLSIVAAESLSSLLFPNLLHLMELTFSESLFGNFPNFLALGIGTCPMLYLLFEYYENKHDGSKRKQRRRR
ncbi:hypothetical protein VDG1235_2614 [Verrucomicrobiia bacterium DG1235]|nr:hypothetical protein VDG1235_2614 [Verrucomicrobiae bacterium DG1235]